MKLSTVLWLACITMILSTAPAHAYLDPGAGSLVLQLVLGGVAGLAVLLKMFWHRILAVLGIKKPAPMPPAEERELGED